MKKKNIPRHYREYQEKPQNIFEESHLKKRHEAFAFTFLIICVKFRYTFQKNLGETIIVNSTSPVFFLCIFVMQICHRPF